VISEPHAIRQILLEKAANYRKDNFQRRMMSALLSNGLLMAEDEQWRLQRRTLAPLFAHKTVVSFAPRMMQAADALVARWRQNSENTIVNVTADVTRVTLDVLERTIFSDGLGRDSEEVRTAMRSYFDNIGRIEPFDLLGLPPFIPRLSRLKVGRALRLFDSAVDAVIDMRRRQLSADRTRVPMDLLTLLLEAQDPETGQGMSQAEVRANAITFIAAGHETTANAITWSLFLLSQSQEWRERVRAEARREIGGPAEDCAERLVDTRAVIEEAIRLYPPIAAISRVAIGPDEVAGHKVKAGSMIVIAPYVLHRHRTLWEQPDVFDPNRFLVGARSAIHRYAYLPFGVGPRICIGSAFALQEAILVVATIAKNFEFELPPGQRVWPVLRVTLRPEGGLSMLVRPERG
jgi:cytochrome P450